MRRSKRKLELSASCSLPVNEEKFEQFIDSYVGRGVFACQNIQKGDILLEYKGTYVNIKDRDEEEENGFRYYFHHDGKTMCIDASHSDGLGRLVNDECSKKANCKMRKIICEGAPRLWLCAIKDIKLGQQLSYDYGVKNLPWRKLKKGDDSPVLYPDSEKSSSALLFVTELVDITINVGNSLCLECQVSEVDTVTWSKEGSILHSNADFKQTFDGTKARLEVVEVFLDDCGTYTCTIKNLEGEKKCSCKVSVKEHEDSLPQEQEESEENVFLKEPVLKGEDSSVSGEELLVGEKQIVITTSCLSPSEQKGDDSPVLYPDSGNYSLSCIKVEDWTRCNMEIFNSLSPLEASLAKKMDLVEVMGKKDKKVPVLLTPAVRGAMDLLMELRDECQISSSNPYFFAKIFGLGEMELQEVARHMGHELNVRRKFYRLQELAKISKFLLAVENGEAHHFSGMSLDDINIDYLPEASDESSSGNSIEEVSKLPDVSPLIDCHGITVTKPDAYQQTEIQDVTSEIKDGISETNTKDKAAPRRTWSASEKAALMPSILTSVKEKKPPVKIAIQKLQNSCKIPSLKELNWNSIKFQIWAMAQQKLRIAGKVLKP